jgi:uncharacterized membrane protein
MAETKDSIYSQAPLSIERLVYFSDAVFAIVITLLVLDIKVPHVDGGVDGLLQSLKAQWSVYLSFLLSFSLTGVVWINHNHMFRYIRQTDHSLLIINCLLLMCVVAIPFSAALLSEYLLRPGATVGAVTYGAVLTIGGIIFNWVWLYATKNGRLTGPKPDNSKIRQLTREFRMGPVLYFVGMLLGFVNVFLSLAVYIILIVYFVLPESPKKRRQREALENGTSVV